MNVIDFGRSLLDSGDLDPVYIALHGAALERDHRSRWLLAYWCYYDVGVASYISEAHNFWGCMMNAAVNTTPTPIGGRWPRGAERRHFRGQQGIDAVADLGNRYPRPEDMMTYLIGGLSNRPGGQPYTLIADRVRSHRGFGPWITFKVADMLDRCCGCPINFDEATVFMFDAPVKGAHLVYQYYHSWDAPAEAIEEGMMVAPRIRFALDYLKQHLGNRYAPPGHDRYLNLQEYETILCKWKSHLNGHYPPGKDIKEVRHSLETWSDVSQTAKRLLEAAPC